MTLESDSRTRYRFGGYELRLDQGELVRGDSLIPLQPQPLRVLAILAARPGDLVRREELFREVWGENTHVDFDRGLNYCIKQIRTALDDDAADPRFIRTVPRYGYRFIAEVERVPPGGIRPATVPPISPMRRAAIAASAVFVLVAITLGMTWWFTPLRSDSPDTAPRAMQEFIRGRFLIDHPSPDNGESALPHFEQAVAIDPGFARAHLALAQAWVREAGDPAENLSRSRSAVLEALELEPGLAEAHAHLASLRLYGDWDWNGADAAYRQAVALQPDSAGMRHGYASYLSLMGRHDEAISQIEQALAIDPVSSVIKADAGWFYYQARQFDDAVRICRAALEFDPENENALWCLLQVFRNSDRQTEALGAARRLATLLEQQTTPAIDRLESFWSWYLDWLERNPHRGSPTAVGLGYLALGERQRALEIFEQAYDRRTSCVLALGADPQVDPLRGDPRFDELLAKIGLPL